MKFLEVKNTNNEPQIINVQHIVLIREGNNSAVIELSNGSKILVNGEPLAIKQTIVSIES